MRNLVLSCIALGLFLFSVPLQANDADSMPELIEAHERYKKALERPRNNYQGELEKEIRLAKNRGDLNLLLELEKELQHVQKDGGVPLSGYKPEKRALLTAKTAMKNTVEAAKKTYKRELESIVKDFVKNGKIEEAKQIQEMLEHMDEPQAVPVAPIRVAGPAIPLARASLEINTDGSARLIYERRRSDAPMPDNFRGTAFPLSAMPKAQAYRGENGVGRVRFDSRSLSGLDDLSQDWVRLENTQFLPEAKRIRCVLPDGKNGAKIYVVKKFALPCKLVYEILDNRGNAPTIEFRLFAEKEEKGLINCWLEDHGNNKFLINGYYCPPGYNPNGHSPRKMFPGNPASSPTRCERTFQLPVEMVKNITQVRVMYSVAPKNSAGMKTDLVQLDVIGRFAASVGFEIDPNSNEPVVQKVDDGPAQRAGLQASDKIVRFNGETRSREEIQGFLDNVQFGDLMTVAVDRNGKEETIRFHAE